MMSVQMIENWSELEGTVRRVRSETALQGFAAVEIEVHEVRPIEGFPHLLEVADGTHLEVLFPEKLVAELAIGPEKAIVVRVRRAGPERIFAHREYVRVEPNSGQAGGA